jgi:hypothetical protein
MGNLDVTLLFEGIVADNNESTGGTCRKETPTFELKPDFVIKAQLRTD